jgi:hypothetical protein
MIRSPRLRIYGRVSPCFQWLGSLLLERFSHRTIDSEMRMSSRPTARINTARVYHLKATTRKAKLVNAVAGPSACQPMFVGATASWGDGIVDASTRAMLEAMVYSRCQ